jgi:hypothetical protein
MKEKLVFFREAICNNQVEIWTLLLDCPGTSSTNTNKSSQKLVLVNTASTVPELLASIISMYRHGVTHTVQCIALQIIQSILIFNNNKQRRPLLLFVAGTGATTHPLVS